MPEVTQFRQYSDTSSGQYTPYRLQQLIEGVWCDVPVVNNPPYSGVMSGSQPIEDYYRKEAAAAEAQQFANRGANSTSQGG